MATLASTDSTPKKVSKANTEGCKICGTVTLANARVIISNSNGKSKIGQDFQAYCSIDVGAEKGVTAYCCRGCKLKLETIVKKIIDMRESFINTNKEKTKRLRLPTGESPQPKKTCVQGQRETVVKRGLTFSNSEKENSSHNDVAPVEKEKTDKAGIPSNPRTNNQLHGMGEDNTDNIIRSYPVYRSINERFGQLSQPLPHRQLFPFYRVFQPPLLPLPTQFMNLRPQPVVKRLSVLTEYTTGFTETKEIAASRQSIALTLAKGSDEDVAKVVMGNDAVKRSCIANILNELSDQCSELCRLNNSSMLRSKTVRDIVSFKFGDFVNRVKRTRKPSVSIFVHRGLF